jgi:death on curing protein
MNVPEWLSKQVVLDIHQQVIRASSGFDGLRDEGGDIFDLAASYAEGIAHNHPFVDGNKRTAFITADIFLDLNGYRLEGISINPHFGRILLVKKDTRNPHVR